MMHPIVFPVCNCLRKCHHIKVRTRLSTRALHTLDLPGVSDQDPKQGTAGPDLDHWSGLFIWLTPLGKILILF